MIERRAQGAWVGGRDGGDAGPMGENRCARATPGGRLGVGMPRGWTGYSHGYPGAQIGAAGGAALTSKDRGSGALRVL